MPRPALAILAALLLAAGCGPAPPRPPGAAALYGLEWSKDWPGGIPRWRAEARDVLGPDVIVFDCHGGYDAAGTWSAFPDEGRPVPMADVARGLKLLYPGRPILLVTCNKRGHTLGVPGVHYAKRLVACNPHVGLPGWALSIDDFVTDPNP